MSVQSQIDRIKGNITNALVAVAEKGVIVPEGSASDALAALIAAIETGGLPDEISALAGGTFYLSSSSTAYAHTITHNLGVVPNFYVAAVRPAVSSGTSISTFLFGIKKPLGSYTHFYAYGYYNTSGTPSVATTKGSASTDGYTDTTLTLRAASSSPLLTGKNWTWMCGVIKDLL